MRERELVRPYADVITVLRVQGFEVDVLLRAHCCPDHVEFGEFCEGGAWVAGEWVEGAEAVCGDGDEEGGVEEGVGGEEEDPLWVG